MGVTLLDSVFSENAIELASGSEGDPSLPCSSLKMSVLNRVELIERIKRGKSPVWPQFQNVSGTCSTLVPIQTVHVQACSCCYDVQPLTAHRRMTTVTRQAKIPDPRLETVQRLLCSSRLGSRHLAPRPPTQHMTMPQLALRSNAQDQHYTLETSGKRRKTQKLTTYLARQSLQ